MSPLSPLSGTGLARGAGALSPEIVAGDARPLVLVVVLLFVVARKADVVPRSPPRVGTVALRAGEAGVLPFPVQPGLVFVAIAARRDRLRLDLLPVAVPARHGHHGGGGVGLVALGAVVGGAVPRGGGFVGQSPGGFAFQGHGGR